MKKGKCWNMWKVQKPLNFDWALMDLGIFVFVGEENFLKSYKN